MQDRKISHYRIIRELGTGGMGEVYLAEDETLHRNVALKLLPAELNANRERIQRFHQEARAASALSHPNIITIFEIGEADGRHFIATEYIDGETLRQRMANHRMTTIEVLDVAIGVASALVAAHQAGIIHRDIKPENIMIRRDGYVKVLDFGLAKLTEGSEQTTRRRSSAPSTDPGMVMGTVFYMSPEQLRGLPLDGRTDIFSLGEVLYEMVTGNAPFDGESTSEVIAAILERDPDPMARFSRHTPDELQRIVQKALQKNPDERYQSARDLLLDVKTLRQDVEFNVRQRRSSGAGQAVVNGVLDRSETRDTDRFPATSGEQKKRSSGASYVVRELQLNRDMIVGTVLLLILIAIAFVHFGRSGHSYESIAVLPFANGSRDPAAEYLSDGITESIIHSLSLLPKLQVMAQSSVFQYKGKMVDPRTAGRDLKVEAILTGRIEQRDGLLLVQADLVDVDRGTLLWGEQYNRKENDLLAVQNDIAQEISEKLRLRLTGEDRAKLAKQYTENDEAYRLYLKGRYYWNKRTNDGLRSAIDFFNQAIGKEPAYALAYAGLADCYSLLPVYGGASPTDAFPKAEAAARRALQLDDSLAEAHTSLAWAHLNYDWDWPAAEAEFRRAIELNPNYATAHQWFSLFLSARGRHRDALAEIHRAQELDPLSLAITTGVGTSLYLAGRYDEAIEQFRKALEMDGTFTRARFELARVEEVRGQCVKAIPDLEELSRSGATPYQTALARAYGRCGRREEALRLVSAVIAKSKETYVNPYEIAAVYAGLGDRDQVFEWLNRAFDAHVSRLVYLDTEPMFESLRSDPRFSELEKKIGLRK